MKCRKILNSMTAYLDKELAGAQKAEFEKHMAECQCCRLKLSEVQRMLSSVNPREDIPLPPEYHSQLHRKLIEIEMGKALNRKSFSLPFNLFKPALAGAFAMLFIFLGLYYSRHRQAVSVRDNAAIEQVDYRQEYSQGKNNSYNLRLNQDGTLQINLNAIDTIKNANFEIELPRGLCRIRGADVDCENKLINWQGDIEKGKNIIYLHVRATEGGFWNVKVKLEKGRQVKRIELPVSINL